MRERLLRITYLSENQLGSTAEDASEINRILAVSQKNNAATGITGALIFNCGFFGQVLEGPQSQVEETFERIQLDARHFNVRVLSCEAVDERAFAKWSMGLVSADTVAETCFGPAAGGGLLSDPARLTGDVLFAALHEVALKNEIRQRTAA